MPSEKEIDAAAQASMETCVKYYTSQFMMDEPSINGLHLAIAKAALEAAEKVREDTTVNWREGYQNTQKALTTSLESTLKREAILVQAIKTTLEENMHLADGDNCTLITLKLALRELGIEETIEEDEVV